ncbi:MAG: glutaredoxin family protein [Pseudomonadales bacterium]|nr:glutaredoxin family protein [Pseudomonadales bacterium]
MTITLLGTESCHLCEEAAGMLQQMGLQATHVDIIDLAQGIEHYGTRIPVLSCQGRPDLAWPFSLLDIERWYQQGKEHQTEIAG